MNAAGRFAQFRSSRPGTSGLDVALYLVAWAITSLTMRGVYRLRALGVRRLPPRGPVLIVANHQSYLDPPIVGTAVGHRMLDFVARRGLFERSAFMRFISRPLNCIPIREDGNDPAAIKEILKRLGEGRAVLIFPEGSRSRDGSMTPFKRGAALLVKRARCPVVPLAIDGAFDAWPRHARRPRVRGVWVGCAFGRPIDSAVLVEGGAESAMAELERRVARLRRVVRRDLRRRSAGRFPPHSPGDSFETSPEQEPTRAGLRQDGPDRATDATPRLRAG